MEPLDSILEFVYSYMIFTLFEGIKGFLRDPVLWLMVAYLGLCALITSHFHRSACGADD